MFVEFCEADDEKTPILLNTEEISAVANAKTHREIHMKSGRNWWVSESFEEIKKRCGLDITPRAETLARNVA